jgi:hypothetical protein
MSGGAAVAAAAVTVAFVAACDSAGDERRTSAAATTETRPGPLPRPLELEAIPPAAARTCRASRLLRPICPRRVPAGRYRRERIGLAPVGRAGDRFDVFELVGARSSGDGEGPRELHFVLVASRYGLGRSVGGAFAAWPRARVGLGFRDGLFRRRRASPILLARVGWNGLSGELVLDRTDRPAAAGHLVYRWHARGVDYAVTLHAWEPLRTAIATLRAVIASTPAAGPRRR